MKYRILQMSRKKIDNFSNFHNSKFILRKLIRPLASYFVIYVGSVVPNELLFNFVLHVDLFRPLRQIAQFDEILFEFFPLFFELIFDLKRKLPTPLVPR